MFLKQLSLVPEIEKLHKTEDLENAMDNICQRFGHYAIQRGIMLTDKKLSGFSPKDDHTVYPVSFFK